jgi:hypothetical protein
MAGAMTNSTINRNVVLISRTLVELDLKKDFAEGAMN